MDLLLGGVDVLISVVEGSEFILSVVLDCGGRSDNWDGGGYGKWSLNWGGNSEGSSLNWCSNGEVSSLVDNRSSNGLDEWSMDSLDGCGLGKEWVACNDPDVGGCCEESRSFGDGDGLNWCEGNSVVGIDW